MAALCLGGGGSGEFGPLQMVSGGAERSPDIVEGVSSSCSLSL